MHLIYATNPPDESDRSLLFTFYQDKLLVKTTENSMLIPHPRDLETLNITYNHKLYIGIINGYPCYTANLDLLDDTFPDNLPQKLTLIGLRRLYGSIDDDLFWAAGRAYHIMNWHRTHLFCGRCGTPTQQKSDEMAKVCPNCGLTRYPAMVPAVIVAVIKDDKILLARNKERPFKYYSVLAGFVESGESLGDCVKREIFEEVGIKVKNISYFGSQPWPFPNSLMIGFTAEYESGEIKVDGKEISEAGWFTKDELPETPGSISIAWRLIQWFKRQ